MKLSANDMRVLHAMRNVLHPSHGGNGDFDGFMPHGSRDWIAIRRLLREGYVEQSNEYGTCQTCSDPHEDAMFTLTHWAFRLFAPEDFDCPHCKTFDCPRFIMMEEKRRNPPRGMGAGLWIHGEPFREATAECWRRRATSNETKKENENGT